VTDRAYVGRVGADGVRITTPTALSAPTARAWITSTWAGDRWAVLRYVESASRFDIVQLGATLSPIGGPIMVGETLPAPGAVVIAWNGIDYGLAWCDGAIHFQRVTTAGVTLPERVFGSCGDDPVLLVDGGEWIVVTRPSDAVVEFERMSSAGESLGAFSIPTASAQPPSTSHTGGQRDFAADIAASGAFHLAWRSSGLGSQLYLQPIDTDGAAIGDAFVFHAVAGSILAPTFARGGADLDLVWREGLTSNMKSVCLGE
jgi:hypothetical protein